MDKDTKLYEVINQKINECAKDIADYLKDNFNNNIDDKQEDISFLEMFGASYESKEIEIPKIQRNYVQGKEARIRNEFVKDIFKALAEGEKLNLDIIFGVEKKEDNIDKFIPIDGQQRLTTLYLVYWYVFFKTGQMQRISNLKFSYEKKENTEDFFTFLRNPKTYDQIRESKKETIAQKIKDTTKYINSKWDDDTTVISALEMLDEIEKQYKDVDNKNLNNIYFKKYLLNLKSDMDVEDLYIKMNSRGRELSNFDKLKAKIENYIKDDIIENSECQKIYKKLNYDWLEMFFNYIPKEKGLKYIKVIKDAEQKLYMFLRKYIIYIFIENDVDKSLNVELTKIEEDNNDELILDKSSKIYSIDTKDFIKRLNQIMDNITTLIFNYEDNRFINVKSIFNDIIEGKSLELQEDLKFYAVIKFLETYNNASERKNEYKNWLRIIRNYIESINHYQKDMYLRVFKNLKILADTLQKITDPIKMILDKQIEKELKLDPDNSWFKTEKLKAKHITTNDIGWINAIEEADTNAYFKGRNYFLFEYIEPENQLEDFIKYQEITEKLFKAQNKTENKNTEYLIQRAMLSTQNLDLYEGYFINVDKYSNIYTFLKYTNNDNTNTWLNELNKLDNDSVRKNLKDFIDSYLIKLSSYGDIDNELQGIIENNRIELYKSDNVNLHWRYYFIEASSLFNASESGNIIFRESEENERQILILSKTRQNSTQWDYITYFLYSKLLALKNNDRDSLIQYQGKVGSKQEFSEDNTLSIAIDDRIYYFIRSEDANYKITLEKNKGTNGEDKKKIFNENFKITAKTNNLMPASFSDDDIIKLKKVFENEKIDLEFTKL